MKRVTSVFAVLATVTLLATSLAALAVTWWRGPESASGPPSGWRVVRQPGGTAAYAVPDDDRWEVRGPRAVVSYRAGSGTVAAVAAPVILDAGYCEAADDPSLRAFAGFTADAVGRAVAATNRRWTQRWLRGLTGRVSARPRPERSRPHRLADATPAVRSHAVVRLPPAEPCQPPRVVVDVVSFSAAGAGGTVTTWVLVRDAGEPGTLPEATAERIVQTLRSRT